MVIKAAAKTRLRTLMERSIKLGGARQAASPPIAARRGDSPRPMRSRRYKIQKEKIRKVDHSGFFVCKVDQTPVDHVLMAIWAPISF